MYQLCYQSGDNTFCGDCMPFYWDGKFWIFHQRDNRNPVPLDGEPLCWSLASTTDFIHYEDHGPALLCGADDEQDQFIYAGSVMEKDGLFHAFYTGYNRDYIGTGKPSQVLMHAVSKDLKKWDKIPEDRIYPPAQGYEPDDWRDPYVLYDEENQRYVMILAARKRKGPKVRRGCTVYLTSKDLKTWEFQGDFWDPELFYTHEMPDLFQMGDYWYFLYSEYSDKHITRYRRSKSMYGPWEAPEDDAFDGRAYYAARTATDGDKRYLFGWIPTRANNFDKNTWQWGGALFVQEVYQREDGTLGVRCPETIEKAFCGEKPCQAALPLTLGGPDRREETVLFSNTGSFFRLDLTLELRENVRAVGIKLFEDLENDIGYEYTLLPGRNRVQFDRTPNLPWYQCLNTGLERPVELAPGKEYRVSIIADGDVCIFYLNGTALSSRMYHKTGDSILLYSSGGPVAIKEAKLFQSLEA